MTTQNINALANSQEIGWADALIIRSAANRVGTPPILVAQGTITAQAPAFHLTGTWNEGSTTFSAITADITNTASAVASRLLDLKLGGASKFHVSRNNQARWIGGTDETYGDHWIDTTNATYRFSPPAAGGPVVSMSFAGRVCAVQGFAFGAVDPTTCHSNFYANDTDSAVEMRRLGAYRQLFRIFNTYTNTTNYERVQIGWDDSNVFQIRPEAAGSGTVRVIHISGLPTSNPGAGILWNNAGTPAIGT